MNIQDKMEECCEGCKHYKAETIEKGLIMNICEMAYQRPEWNEELEACECECYKAVEARW